MKFATTAFLGLLLADKAAAFAPYSPVQQKTNNGSSKFMAMDIDMPPSQGDVPVIQKSSYGPTDVRYSDFLRLVNGDKIEKVTFSADGTQLLGVDVDGTRLKIESLPNDPDLLTSLTQHKVRIFRYELFYTSTVVSYPFFFSRLMSLSSPHKKQVDSENSLKASSSLPPCSPDSSS